MTQSGREDPGPDKKIIKIINNSCLRLSLQKTIRLTP